MKPPLPENNPLEPQFVRLLRSFVQGRDFAAAEVELAANAYLQQLRMYLLGTRDVWALATITAPTAVQQFLSAVPRVDIETAVGMVRVAAPVGAPAIDVLAPATVELVRSSPILARTAMEVSQTISRGGTAFARASSLAVAEHVQEVMGNLIETGADVDDAAAVIEAATDWNLAYAQTAYRTTAMRAYNAARMEQQNQPFVSEIFIGFEVVGSDDADTRRGRVPVDRGEHHKAVLGLVAPTNDPIWLTHTPPYGYNCRHFLNNVSRMRARRRGWLDAGGNLLRQEPAELGSYAPHPGFGRKPRLGS